MFFLKHFFFHFSYHSKEESPSKQKQTEEKTPTKNVQTQKPNPWSPTTRNLVLEAIHDSIVEELPWITDK